jgi:galactokinase
VNRERFSHAFEQAGLPAADLDGRVALLDEAVREFRAAQGTDPIWTWWVPGRIEVFGKHTDYAGGRSLVAAVPRGFVIVAGPRADRVVTARDARWRAAMEMTLDDAAAFSGWQNYVAVVARRLARNFPGAELGADIVFASDLPRAAGVSSSSALVVGVALALAKRGRLAERAEWTAAIRNGFDLAGYLGAVENGLTFGPLEGLAGVGTHGGSEDHTAIINGRPERLSAFAYVPVRAQGDAAMPDGWQFVVMSSGVEASKAGAAMEQYNRASLATRALVDVVGRRTGQPLATLAAAIELEGVPGIEAAVDAEPHDTFSRDQLRRRLAHFVAEDARIPAALAAVACADARAMGELSFATQRDADQLLGNQIPETAALAAMARDTGAFAASSFGAGFGGSVWALVEAQDAAAFASRWQARYLGRFSPSKPVAAFLARPAPPATELALTE